MPGAATLVGRGMQKRFGGITAIASLDITLETGRIVGLIGPNGAGKTTAFNLLTGFLSPTNGSITYRGHSLTRLKAHQIVRAGVGRSFQDLRLFPHMTVLDNVMVALPHQAGDNLAYPVPAARRWCAARSATTQRVRCRFSISSGCATGQRKWRRTFPMPRTSFSSLRG